MLEPKLLAYLFLIEPYDDLAIYNGSWRRLRVDLDHFLHGVEVGADVLLDKVDISLRQELYLCVADRSAGRRVDDYVVFGHSSSSPLLANASPS